MQYIKCEQGDRLRILCASKDPLPNDPQYDLPTI